ncbi:hypothetical protein HK102_005046, partial [Quaeritorhiza haematococci]
MEARSMWMMEEEERQQRRLWLWKEKLGKTVQQEKLRLGTPQHQQGSSTKSSPQVNDLRSQNFENRVLWTFLFCTMGILEEHRKSDLREKLGNYVIATILTMTCYVLWDDLIRGW